MATPKKCKQLTIEAKYDLIQEVERKHKPKSEIAKEFRINPSTLMEIVKNGTNCYPCSRVECFFFSHNRCNKQLLWTDFFKQ